MPEIKYLVSCVLYFVNLVSCILAKTYVFDTITAYDITKAYEKRLFFF